MIIYNTMATQKRRTNKRRTEKRRRVHGGNDSTTAALQVWGNGSEQHAMPGSNVIASTPVNVAPLPTKGGDKKKGGKGLTELAVPAVLLLANNMVKKPIKIPFVTKGGKKSKTSKRRN
jgi:hypothetical protein